MLLAGFDLPHRGIENIENILCKANIQNFSFVLVCVDWNTTATTLMKFYFAIINAAYSC